MANINTGSLAAFMWPGIKHIFGVAYNEFPLQYKELFNEEASEKGWEQSTSLYGLGLAQVKRESSGIPYGSMAQGFTKRHTHVVYAHGYTISREAIEDNQYMEVGAFQAKALAFAMRQTKENIAAQIFNRAFNASYVGADGKELCSNAHKLEKGGTFSNVPAVASDLSEASLEQACIDIMDFRDGAGLRISVKPRKLVIPKELMFDAKRILSSDLRVDTAMNDINALKSMGIFSEAYTVNNYFSDSDAFFILTDIPNGLRHYQRRALELENDTDFDSEVMKFKATERYVFGWDDPRAVYGSQGA